jgi:hypothetical protein
VLFLTAASIGLVAGMMRSAFSIALIAVLIVATFALASLFNPGPASYSDLLVAILGYNCGLVGLIGGSALIHRERSA